MSVLHYFHAEVEIFGGISVEVTVECRDGGIEALVFPDDTRIESAIGTSLDCGPTDPAGARTIFRMVAEQLYRDSHYWSQVPTPMSKQDIDERRADATRYK